MTISISRYVDISSGVGGGASVAQRELIGRLFSDNPRTPADSVAEFTSADDVAAYYGATSEEALRAIFYFGYISKSVGSPRKISFARWAKVANEARIYGRRAGTTLAQFQAIAAGDVILTVGGQTANLPNIDLTAANSLTAVAAAVQAAIRAAAGTQFASALVAYDAVAGTFNFTSSLEQAADITVSGDLADLLGWTGVGVVLSPGVTAESITAALSRSAEGSNNFGAFAFALDLTDDEIVEAATWNAAQNVAYMFLGRVTATNAANVMAEVIGLSGAGITLAPDTTQYDELLPAAVLAATRYERRGSVQNYMYQQAALSPKVSSDADADSYDSLRVNYYGATQTGGQTISFYQRGVLCGPSTAPVDMNTYANEMWLKDAAQSALMGLLLAVPRVPANAAGRGMVLASLQDPIDRALINGTISVGRFLTPAQKVAIETLTGDPLAFHQIESVGYWVDVVMEPFTTSDGRTEWKAVYTLVYAKDDAVRKVEGSHALI